MLSRINQSQFSIKSLNQWLLLSENENDENVALVFKNSNQDSSTFAKNIENSIELIDKTIWSNSKEILNSLIMINRWNKIWHDYKQLHMWKFAKTAKLVTAFHQIAIFSTYKKAISRFQINQWKQIMQVEYFNQMKRRTFQIVSLSYDQKAIDDKWVFKLKENLDESITRYKVKWVVKSYRQIKNRNFDETYISIVKSNTFRMMLAIVSVLNYQIKQFDIKTIFLYDQINRMIYIDQSKNFEKKNINSFKTCLLNIDLYDLMQNFHFWFDEIKRTVIEYDLT